MTDLLISEFFNTKFRVHLNLFEPVCKTKSEWASLGPWAQGQVTPLSGNLYYLFGVLPHGCGHCIITQWNPPPPSKCATLNPHPPSQDECATPEMNVLQWIPPVNVLQWTPLPRLECAIVDSRPPHSNVLQ